MNPPSERTGVLGGTFDPVHAGHLAAADAACLALGLERVILIPSHVPPHRAAQPQASEYHRFAMVSLAVGSHPQFAASDLELRRPGPSYTADTLRRLHQDGLPASQLFFILGTDACAEIAAWHQYPAVLDLANFVVISRPGQSFDVLRERLPELAHRVRVVGSQRPGNEPGRPCAIFFVNAPTPDVSSTVVRERAARGESLDGLVAPEVERHIERHRLYHR
jgi:nicotinate-nucleotide adenylyltransferase